MCGRYALGIRASFVRYQLQQQGLQVDDAPEDDQARETYNFPPGSYGLVYRAEVPDHGVRNEEASEPSTGTEEQQDEDRNTSEPQDGNDGGKVTRSFNYELKVMKWGLIPFWTKRSPDYGSMMRTINCRDDSLIENRGMWTSMKERKRCLVIAQGFYEWLKKGPGGKEKVPHFVKRKDGQLMCFAGLWDCVKYEGTEEKLYTYSIITTDSNKQLQFLHDRMPVILDPSTDAMKLWLDPTKNKWSKELQAMLKPFEGELECYPVSKEVGKVGNNSPDFIVPVNSKDNKKNIANFFDNAKKDQKSNVEKEPEEMRDTVDHEGTEDNAPLPIPKDQDQKGTKRPHDDADETPVKAQKLESSPQKALSPPSKPVNSKTRSATSNAGSKLKSSPAKKTEPGTQRITNFFVK